MEKEKPIYSLKVSILLLIILMTFFVKINSATISQDPYGQYYTVKKGDSMDYNYTFINYNHKNYYSGQLDLVNNAVIDVNLTVGTIISVKVTEINTSNDGNDKVYTQNAYLIPHRPTYVINPSPFTTFLIKAFDNKSMLDEFVTQFSYYSSDDKYLTEILNSNSSNSDLILNTEYSYNWHTGWLEYSVVKDFFSSNGSLLNEVRVQRVDRVTNHLINALINYLSLAVVLGIPILIVGVIVYSKRNKFLVLLKASGKEQNKQSK